MDADTATTQLFRVLKTALQMLSDRKYIVRPELLSMTLEDFKNEGKTRDNINQLFKHKNDAEGEIYLIFSNRKSMTKEDIDFVAQKMNEHHVKKAILIGSGPLTPICEKQVGLLQGLINIEYFDEKDLIVNITEHELVPQHVILTDEEKKELLKRYRVKESQLPKISKNDPVARYFGLKRGQVVKIIRPSETAGKYVTYRLAL